MSPKMVTRALARPVHPGICTTSVALVSSNKFLPGAPCVEGAGVRVGGRAG